MSASQTNKESFQRAGSASDLAKASNFIAKSKHGIAGEEDEEFDPDIIAKVEGMTPSTKRRVIKEENIKK